MTARMESYREDFHHLAFFYPQFIEAAVDKLCKSPYNIEVVMASVFGKTVTNEFPQIMEG